MMTFERAYLVCFIMIFLSIVVALVLNSRPNHISVKSALIQMPSLFLVEKKLEEISWLPWSAANHLDIFSMS